VKSSNIIKLIAVMAILSVFSVLGVRFIAGTFIWNVLHSNLMESAERNQIIYTNEIDEWFAVAKERVRNIALTMEQIPLEEIENMAINFVERTEMIENVFIGFSDGRLKNGVNWVPDEGWTPIDRPWYIAARAVPYGEVVVTGTYISYATGNIAVSVATYVPGLGGSGATVGTAIPVNTILEKLALHDVMGGGYLILVDMAAGGQIIAHPNPVYAPDADGTTMNIEDIVNGQTFVLYLDAPEIIQFDDTRFGEAYLISTPLGEVDWTLISVIPTSSTERAITMHTNVIIIVFSAFSIILMAITLVSSLKIIKKMGDVKASEARLRMILDAMPLVTNFRDADFNIRDCNETSARLFGLKDKDEYLQRYHELSPELQPCGMSSKEKAEMLVTETFVSGYSRFEWMHQTIDGEPVPCEVTLTKVDWDNLPHLLAFVRDLRDVYKYREAQEAERQRLQLFIDYMPLGCSLRNKHFEILDCNETVLKIFGIKTKEDYVSQWNNLIPDFQPDGWRSRDMLNQAINTAIETGKSRIEWVLQKLDGTSVPIETIIACIKWQSEDCMVVFMRDLTESYNYRREKEEMLDKLEELLQEARAASQAKSIFLSNMSHEIRTPINAISGMIKIGKSASDIDSKNSAFERIETASTYLLGIIADVLEMSKIDAGKLELNNHPFEFKKMVEGVSDMLHFEINKKKLELMITLDDSIPQNIIGDEVRLAQVISNLLSNAIKFSPPSGRIDLNASLVNNKIHVEIIDTGIGISEEQQARLFNAFEQAESTTTRKFGGTGLGLAISKRIIEAMGGEILIESELGKGAKFMFNIPFETADINAKNSVSTVEDEYEGCFEGCCLLIVDDVDINREILITLLEPTGIEIEYAQNGAEAVGMFHEHPSRYDAIFMDIQMPIMDGFTATRRIREFNFDWAKQIPIIAITANVFQEDIEQCMLAGMNDHLGKPINIELAIKKLKEFITKK